MTGNPETVSRRLLVSSAPHIHAADDVSRVMWEVNIALAPALIMALYFFGARAAVIVGMTVLGAVAAEAMVQKWFLGTPLTLGDGSAVLTGILLAFCVPAALPWWVAFIGGFVAVVLGKQVYGGLGQNIFNPAHVARAILLASWPVYMTTWLKPGMASGAIGTLPDGITGATPLGFMKEALRDTQVMEQITASGTTMVQYAFTKLNISWSDLFLGNIAGSLGETSKIALLIGCAYLLIRGHITWQIPATMVATVALGTLLIERDPSMMLYHLLSGGLFIGAIFMATDMVTSPMTTTGHLIFGFGCGAITLLIRLKGGYPEGVCYSILIMNAIVPLIDRFTVPAKFGQVDPRSQEAKA